MESLDRLLSIIAILIGVSYVSIFLNLGLEILCNILIILLSYYTLIRFNVVYPIIFLILSARIINGFTFGISCYGVMSILTNYLPSLIYIIRNRYKISIDVLISRRFIFIFLLLTWGYFLVNIHGAMPLLSKQIIPFTLFCCFISGLIDDDTFYESKGMVSYLRIVFFVSLIVFLLPNYENLVDDLYKSGEVFGVPADDGIFVFQGIVRNNGLFFDHRIMGIIATLYIYIIIRMYGKLGLLDLLLSFMCLLSTTSRGAIITYLAVLAVYYYSKYKILLVQRMRFILIIMTSAIITLLCFNPFSSGGDDYEKANKLISTFDLSSEDNALSQRSVFSLFALNEFIQYPITGKGLGELTALSEKSKNVDSDSGVIYDVVTDAFLFSLLAEMGIVGFVLFVLSFWQICTGVEKDMYSIALYIALLIQMTGTDLPNMYMFYFVVILMLQHPDIFTQITNDELSETSVILTNDE